MSIESYKILNTHFPETYLFFIVKTIKRNLLKTIASAANVFSLYTGVA